MYRFFYWLLPLLFLIACVENENETIDLEADKAYFPLTVGKYREYQVDSMIFRQGRLLDSVHLFLREEILSVSKDSLGDVYIILRSTRKGEASSWRPIATLSARYVDYTLLLNENNVNIVKLVFPLSLVQSWDGLAYVNPNQTFDVYGESIELYAGWESFKINALPQKESFGSLSFDQTVTILQTDEDDFLSKRFSIEKYAKGVGLVYKEQTILDCNSRINTCDEQIPWRNRATKGFITKHTLLKHN